MTDYFGADLELKLVDIPRRLIAGLAAAHHNIDRVRDIIDPGASAKATQRLAGPSDVAVLVGHNSAMLPVGIPQVIEATPAGLYTETYVLKGPAGDNLLAVAKDLLDHGQALGMSIGYKTHDSRRETAAGKTVRRIMDYELKEYSFASQQAIANPQALVSAVKATAGDRRAASGDSGADDGHDDEQEHVSVNVNDLANASFLYVEPGDDDEEGKRVPRSRRHFPYKDAEHKLDLPALRDAVARIPQSSLPDDVKTQLWTRARRLLAHAEGGKTLDEAAPEWKTGTPQALYGLGCSLLDLSEQVAAELKAMTLLGEETKGYQRIPARTRDALEAVVKDLSRLVTHAETIDRGEDGKQRLAWFKQQLALTEV